MPSEYRITCDTGRPEFTGQPAALRHNYSPRWISAAVESISGAAQAASAFCHLTTLSSRQLRFPAPSHTLNSGRRASGGRERADHVASMIGDNHVERPLCASTKRQADA